MDDAIYAYSIPVFLILIAIELIYGYSRNRQTYRFADSINNLSTGILSLVTNAAFKGIVYFIYLWVYEHWALLTPPQGSWSILYYGCALLLTDLCYYWLHRACHEINFLWGAHQPHHQSESFNLSTALRQGAFQGIFTFIFYLPLAIFGCSPITYLTLVAINTLYQFWVHTEHVGRCGILERIFVTPSHHRVHHGRNPEYLDKNHGGILIIWDKLFGTFVPEKAQPSYGVTTPMTSLNPIRANFFWWSLLLQDAKQTKNWWHKLTIWIMPTGWRPPDVRALYDYPTLPPLAQPICPISIWQNVYVMGYLTVILVLLAFFLTHIALLTWYQQLLYSGLIIWGLFAIGLRLENRSLSWGVEFISIATMILLLGRNFV